MLHGRTRETAALDQLLAAARTGRSGTLVLRGEAGIGKSVLLDHASRTAEESGMRVLRGTGIEAEGELPFAGLHLMLSGALDRIGALPEAQAGALRSAFGLAPAAGGGDRFLVGLAVLTLLDGLAEERPLLCLVDDAHWLDRESANALLFAARRLNAEPVAVVFASRDDHASAFPAPGLPELRLSGLDFESATALLAEHAAGLPRHARDVVLKEAAGNPLALCELPTAQREEERYASPYGITALPPHSRLLRSFSTNVAALPEPTRALLLVAAAAGSAGLDAVLAATERFGATLDDLEPAEQARLLHLVDGALAFRHPLVRTAVYQGATASRRLAVHRALADALDGRPGGADQRAWHLAAAGTGTDPVAARLLEESAERARARGSSSAVAAAYERAAALTPDDAGRSRRLTAAARAAADAGRLDHAEELAARAVALTDEAADPAAHAAAVLVRAEAADEQGRSRDAYALLAGTAERLLAGPAPDTAGPLLLRAAHAAWHAGDQAALDAASARTAGLRLPGADRVAALARLAAGQHRCDGAAPADGGRAVRELIGAAGESTDDVREAVQLGWWHMFHGDLTAARDLAGALERQCREQGAIGVLGLVQMLLARTQLLLGLHREALATATDGLRTADDTGQARVRVHLATVLAQLAAVRGDEEGCRELTAEALALGIAPGTVHAAGALSLLDLGLGRHAAALDRLMAVVAAPDRQGVIGALPDLVEAAVRHGSPEPGRSALDWYEQHTSAHSRRPWAEAVALRCRALLTRDPEEAEALYARAVRRHQEGAGSAFERARTELLHGEHLRRMRRTGDARARLRSALETFERLGAAPWAERARAELRAGGESLVASGAPAGPLDQLTPQELQVATLAAQGLSNRDIGARLFISPRTAGYHLSNVYPKLGITGRRELTGVGL
ncbi:LuxR family transcriptional regulator [Streptomyces thioluteus]|uniref:LuxR family transcriptional regulator n=1 Tax=Streptomyces thioluteus TaxID=66431 RepID=A0ABN3WXG4_STRTU